MGKRFYLGLILIIVLLILGLFLHFLMTHTFTPMAEALADAAEASFSGDWDRALSLSRAVKRRWDSLHKLTAAAADQTPMDETDRLFAELDVFGRSRNQEHFASCCRQLAVMCRAMSEAHSPAWWNLL